MATYHRVSFVDPATGHRTTRVFDEGDYLAASRCERIARIIDNMQDVTLEEFLEVPDPS